jgi:uncharacterized protein YecE (DUF72 family)
LLNPPASIHIGSCAWSFDDWRGVFYPEHLPASERLGFYSGRMNSVEVDSTFYAVPAPHVTEHWAEVTPPDFLFSAKMPREITHERALRDCIESVHTFLAGLAPLHSKLACVLVQLPPFFTLKQDEHTLREFIRHLPHDRARFAIEFRDASWHLPRIVHLLEEHRVCWVWNDLSTLEAGPAAPFGSWPQTTDFVYLRLMGDLEAKYAAGGEQTHRYRKLEWPREAAVENWVEKVRGLLPDVKRVLIYANNQYEGFAPETAARFAAHLGMPFALPTAEELSGTDSQQLKLL